LGEYQYKNKQKVLSGLPEQAAVLPIAPKRRLQILFRPEFALVG